MATRSQRFFALFFALLFLVTSSSVAIAYILANVQSKQNATPSKTSAQSQTNSSQSTNKTKLAGTLMENFTPVSSVTSLQVTDLVPGTGATVAAGDTVTVDYTGAVAATGIIFQSSLDSGQPVTFGLNQVIAGWTQGIPGMKVGGTRRLLIPASLAYGANPPSGSGIPANAALVFDVTVHSIGSK